MRRSQPQPRLRGRAFTIIELLVVIGLISVLIAILFPTIRRARAQAMFIDCQSRIRSQLQAHVVYSNDYHDVKAPLYAKDPSGWWFSSPVLPNVRWDNMPIGQGILVMGGYLPLDSLLDQLDGMQEDAANDRWMWSNYSYSGSSYWYFWRHPADKIDFPTYRQCWQNGRKALVMDTNADDGAPFTGVPAAPGWTAHPVVQRMNVGYGDGSVRSFPMKDIRLSTAPDASLDAHLLVWFDQANQRY